MEHWRFLLGPRFAAEGVRRYIFVDVHHIASTLHDSMWVARDDDGL